MTANTDEQLGHGHGATAVSQRDSSNTTTGEASIEDPDFQETNQCSQASSDVDTDFDEEHESRLHEGTPAFMFLNTRTTMDLYDILPPELLDAILRRLSHRTLLSCATLSKRWARMVVPHLWRAPWMMYYVSWMKLLHTISHASMTTGLLSSTSSGRIYQQQQNYEHMEQDSSQDSSSFCAFQQTGIDEEEEEPSTGTFDIGKRNNIQKGPRLAWDNFSDHEDDDPSGLLRLAENQRRESIDIQGWEPLSHSSRSTMTMTRHLFTMDTTHVNAHTPAPLNVRQQQCGNGTTLCSGVHESNLSSDTTAAFLEERPFNVQGISRLCPPMETATTTPSYPFSSIPAFTTSFTSLQSGTSTSSAKSTGVRMRTKSTASQSSSGSNSGKRQRRRNKATSCRPSLTAAPLTTAPAVYVRPNYGQFIRVLDFSELYYIISDKFLIHLFPHTPALSTLVISAPKQFTDDALYVLATCCHQLTRLEFPGCDQITDRGIHYLLDHAFPPLPLRHHHPLLPDALERPTKGRHDTGKTMRSYLQVLTLSNHVRITDGILQHLAYSPLATHLERLNLANASFITAEDPGLATIVRCCTTLVALDISHCQGVTDTLLGMLSCGATLRELNIAHCYQVMDKGLMFLSDTCYERLEMLDITACTQVTDRGVYAVGMRCKNFKLLILEDLQQLYNGHSHGHNGSSESESESRAAEQVLELFPWGASVLVQQRQRVPGWGNRYSRIF
ncbi:hypothetical protein BGZ94_004180 [Podila epigama]|nr:hypothetical protein BGZ94_004180 [Podila epigama]